MGTDHARKVEDCDLGTLLQRLNAGEEALREEILDCLHRWIHPIVVRRLNEFKEIARWETAPAITNEVVEKVNRKLIPQRFGAALPLLQYCLETLRNHLIDQRKKHYGPEGVGKNHATSAGLTNDEGREPVGRSHGPYTLAVDAEAKERLDRAISSLPEKYRLAFVLVEIEGLSRQEAATLLGISAPTVTTRCAEAMSRLSNELKELK